MDPLYYLNTFHSFINSQNEPLDFKSEFPPRYAISSRTSDPGKEQGVGKFYLKSWDSIC